MAIKLTNLLKEIKINKPFTAGYPPSNKILFDFLNQNIRAFAEHELKIHRGLFGHILDEFYHENENTDEFEEEELGEMEMAYNGFDEFDQQLWLKIKDRIINKLVTIGLDYYGEHESDDDDDYGVSWNTEIGLIYNNNDEPNPGSYIWIEEEFKNIKFYVMNFNI